ncbi:hypothetical protein CPC735_020540 [Coccidioides posadasii C735 delta SOWgp]|nr:hypothetical protein CPC735_020540 [Coccidioides posadasii C735 delta SOWgp]EER23026.1 hypothetical protein CPC735_020540 [Coccidioides posadasii C735 delta SOWgp]KMM69182.1 hypothetical protein CPAG_05503 [Coccidioides posadasii RMSCC 3488]|eukprot:XP_003065171.1 hypothetical protein CPC735_020540 [Coccidioides posadasii C735 delta SOWgp]
MPQKHSTERSAELNATRRKFTGNCFFSRFRLPLVEGWRSIFDDFAGNGSMVQGANMSQTAKYYIYSSKAPSHPGPGIQIDRATSANTDNFVSLLKAKLIILNAKPNAEHIGYFDQSDEWWKWLKKLDPDGSCQFSLVLDATEKEVQSFEFQLTSPAKMAFSSSAGALKFAFGADSSGKQAKIPVPGLFPEGTMLYCGLDPSKSDVGFTVGEALKYTGRTGLIPFLPQEMTSWKLLWDKNKASEKRNALWFNPCFASQTTIRMQLQLEEAGRKSLEEWWSVVLKDIQVKNAEVVCKKTLTEGKTAAGTVGVHQGQITFKFECSVEAKPKPVDIVAAIAFQEAAVQLTFQPKTSVTLGDILDGLAKLLSQDLGSMMSILTKEDIFQSMHFRRLTVTLDTLDGVKKPKLSRFEIDIEVSAKFGKKTAEQNVVFLLTYIWTKRRGSSISGQFWNGLASSEHLDVSPYYEEWIDMKPLAPNPAPYIDLTSIVPGEEIKDIPDNIPTEIESASIMLSGSDFAMGGVIKAKPVTPGSIPQPYLGRIRLFVSYAWVKKKDFKLSFGFEAGLEPSKESKHQQPAILTGDLEYNSKS